MLALVSVRGSIHYVVLPGLRRDELLERPQVGEADAAAWWRGGGWPESRERAAGHLVASAGPAGLALALHAHDHGAVVRVVERQPEAFRPSRALILHSRTLEVLRPLGVTQALLARAAFWAEASTGGIPSALRGRLAPLAALVPAPTGRARLVAEAL